VQHLSMFDFVAVSGDKNGRMIEFVDHLHEHFVTPVDVHGGSYWPPSAPGGGSEIVSRTLADYSYPDGPVWSGTSPALTTQH
jgi:L-fuconate dehydratase